MLEGEEGKRAQLVRGEPRPAQASVGWPTLNLPRFKNLKSGDKQKSWEWARPNDLTRGRLVLQSTHMPLEHGQASSKDS